MFSPYESYDSDSLSPTNETLTSEEIKSPKTSASTNHSTTSTSHKISKDRIQRIADFLKQETHYRPEFGLICGSGLANISSALEEKQTFQYREIPEFPQSTVSGHSGELVFGKLNNAVVICMKGRFHTYEGYEIQTTTLPIRIMALLGVKFLLITNAAGALNPSYEVGDLMFISDHLNFPGMAGKHPLVGPNDERFGTRFLPLTECYDLRMRNLGYRSAVKLGIENKVHTKGVYCFVSGPSYETPTEARLLRLIGGDAVGMSTVPEVIVAYHSGIKVFAMSLITNKVILPNSDRSHPPTHEEVLKASEEGEKDIRELLIRVVDDLYKRHKDEEYLNDQGERILRRTLSGDMATENNEAKERNRKDLYWKGLLVAGCMVILGLSLTVTKQKATISKLVS